MDTSYEKLLDNLGKAFEKAVTNANFYWQSLAIIACLATATLFYKLGKRIIFNQPTHQIQNNFIKKYFVPLFLPILAIISLSIGVVIFSNFYKDNFIFYTVIQLITLFIFLRFIRILFESTLVANLIGIFLVPALILNIFDLLDPTTAYLDNIAINIGKIKISIYTVIKAFITLLIVFWLSGLISRKSKAYFNSHHTIKSSTKGIISKIIDILIYFVVLVIILRVFGVDMTTFAVIGGALGVGIGFGLQKIASNFISGIILLFEKSVEIGDMVEIDGGKVVGTITHFGGRYTLIETTDGKEIMVPNEDFITNKVNNWTFNNSRGRVEIEIAVTANSDLNKAQEIMLNAAKEHPRCLDYPTIDWYVTEYCDGAIKMALHFWVGDVTEGRMRPKSDVMMKILERFREHNIALFCPQREVSLKNK